MQNAINLHNKICNGLRQKKENLKLLNDLNEN